MTAKALTAKAQTVSLSERYIQEVARRLPDGQRTGIAAELRGTIADTVDGRIAENGLDVATAERVVLQELGDPSLLAMKYRDKPLYLIGPDYFPAYWQLLRKLVPLIPAIVGGVVFGADLLSGDSVLVAAGDGVGTAVTVFFHVLFWVTLVFAVIERRATRVPEDINETWTPDNLPDHARAARLGVGELIASLIGIAMIAVFLLWQRTGSPLLGTDDESVALFHPDLWNGWIFAIYATLAAFVVVEIAKYRQGHWTYPLAWWNAIANAAFVGVLAGLTFADRLINPAFVDTIENEFPNSDVANFVDWAATNFWILVAIFVVIDITQAFLKAREGSLVKG